MSSEERCSTKECGECGVNFSPEWRRGPKGPHTLCNACGLRYSKMQKKKSHVNSSACPNDRMTVAFLLNPLNTEEAELSDCNESKMLKAL